LVILDIDTATKTTSKGTVVSSAVVFATGPTLAGSSFAGSNAAGNRLPYQSVKAVYLNGPHAGEMTKEWRDSLQGGMNGVQTVQTQQNNTPVTMPPPGFGSVNGMAAPGPNSPLSITSADGSVTVTTMPATSTVDLSVVTAGSQWIPAVTGAEPPVLVSDGNGNLVLVSYP